MTNKNEQSRCVFIFIADEEITEIIDEPNERFRFVFVFRFRFDFFFFLELRQAFDLFDYDRSGFISSNELKKALLALGIQIDEHEVKQIFSSMDLDSKNEPKQFDLFLSFVFCFRS